MRSRKKKLTISEYNAIFQEEQEGGYSVWVPSLPGCTSQGETFEEAQKNIKEAVGLYLKDEEEDSFDTIGIHRQFMAPVRVKVYA